MAVHTNEILKFIIAHMIAQNYNIDKTLMFDINI